MRISESIHLKREHGEMMAFFVAFIPLWLFSQVMHSNLHYSWIILEAFLHCLFLDVRRARSARDLVLFQVLKEMREEIMNYFGGISIVYNKEYGGSHLSGCDTADVSSVT